MIDAVIFDLDGTIVNLPIDYKKLEAEIKKHAKTDDVKPVTKTIAGLDVQAKKEVFRVWSKLEAEAWKKATVNQNVIELFEKYHFERKALVTMQGEALADEISKALNLRFDFIITREISLDRFKQLVLAKEKLGVDFSRILFVGNTEGDQKAAERANCQFLKV
ncbi:MAG: HAD hydrolase-like protein [Candidatus Bathyarchaeota archaeon]|nr:HAD hydrolase-like protein [Candidatus Bathyarchaeota archaeon]